MLWRSALWWAREERGNSEFLWISCSSRRKWGNALFKKVPGHGGNGFPSMAARAVLAAAWAGLLLKSCPSPLSFLHLSWGDLCPGREQGPERRCCCPSPLPAGISTTCHSAVIVGDASRNAVGTGGEHGHSRDTIAQVGHWQGSLKSPGTIQLWSCSMADTALPARATPGSCTTMRSRLPFCTEHSRRKPTHSFLLCPHPTPCTSSLETPSGLLKALWLSGTQLLVTWQRNNRFVMPILYFYWH